MGRTKDLEQAGADRGWSPPAAAALPRAPRVMPMSPRPSCRCGSGGPAVRTCRVGTLMNAFLLVAALLWLPSLHAQVILNEIMYHPVEEPAFTADGSPVLDLTDDVHEFVELFNTTDASIDLAGWQLANGLTYTFPAGARIAAHGFVVVAKNPARLAAIASYGLSAPDLYGPFAGQL